MTERFDESTEKVSVAPPERVFTSVVMAAVALLNNVVRPTREEVRSHIERSSDPYFRAFLTHCMTRVYGRR